jgi:hypothetical protein
MSAIGNSVNGVLIRSLSTSNLVGDTVNGFPISGNVISGNGNSGVSINGSFVNKNLVFRNRIGTNIIRTAAIPNGTYGVSIENGASNNIIGSDRVSYVGTVSGNTFGGIRIFRSDSNTVTLNIIGLNGAGSAALPNAFGISIDSSRAAVVSYNQISGNTQNGLILSNSAIARVEGNMMGADGTWAFPVPNGQSGILIEKRARVDSAKSNVILFNGHYGIRVDGSATDSSIFYQNLIYKNTLGGILFQNGAQKVVSPPRISGVALDSTVSGQSAPNAFIQVYADSVGQGQGRFYLGETTADGNGDWSQKVNLIPGTVVTALQDSANNTSEFASPGPGMFVVLPSTSIDFGTVVEGDSAEQTFSITASGGYVAVNAISAPSSPSFTIVDHEFVFPDTLNPGEDTVSVRLRFVPQAAGSFADTVVLQTPGGYINVTLQGVASSNSGNFVVLPSAVIDFGTVTEGDTVKKIIAVTASGGIVVLDSISGPGGTPFRLASILSQDTELPIVLEPGIDTVAIILSFEPTTGGVFADTMRLYSPTENVEVALQGTASELESIPPALTINLLRSTVADQYVDIAISSSEGLTAIAGTLTLHGTADITPARVGTNPRLFTVPFHLSEGTLSIDVTGTDSAGNMGTKSRSYVVGSLGRGSFSFKHGRTEIKGSSYGNGFVLLSTAMETSDGRMSKVNGWTAIAEGVDILITDDRSGVQSMVLHSSYDQKSIHHLRGLYPGFDERKIGLYYYSITDESWIYVGGEGMNSVVTAKLLESGHYALFYNPDHQFLLRSIELSQNYPNPFNPSTTITYGLPAEGRVVLNVYNVLGQKVRELVNGKKNAGYHRIVWDGTGEAGRQVSTGIYFYRLITAAGVQTRKMLLIK